MKQKTTFFFVCKTLKYFLLSLLFTTLLTTESFAQSNPVTYFEDFNSPGYPSNIPAGSYWTFHNEIHPSQDTWEKFIPGDGYAYIKVDPDTSNDLDWIHPFQTLEFGGAGENHRLEVRMKGAVTDGGLVGFLFTYEQEGSIFNEVDIEIVADDSATPSHETLPENGGWTDARFNTWRNANENSGQPFTGTMKAVVNDQNEKISLIDDEFHTYTIDWREDRIDFFIDGVLQETITTNVAEKESEIIFGFRQLPWAGNFNWTGVHTMVIDYLKIEPIEPETFAATDFITTPYNTPTVLDVLNNDTANTTIVSFDTTTTQGNTITGNANELTFTPLNLFIGEDSFTYTIEDDEGVQVTATVHITASPRPLDAVNDVISVATNSAVTSIDVIANDDFGPYGAHPGHPLTLPGGKTISASTNHGAIAVVNGKIDYTPANGFTGTDTFNYTLTDGYGFASSATVTITVGGTVVVDANAVIDNYTINEDTATNFEVLANDAGVGISIIAYDTTTTAGQSVSQLGTLLTYTPANGFTGTDTFTYTIEDTNGVQSTATVNVTVQEVVIDTGVLTANDDTVSVGTNSAVTAIDVTANDNYGTRGAHPGHPLTLPGGKTISASNNHGAIAVVNGKINYTPANGFTGTDTFNYTITDGGGFASSATVTITVGGTVVIDANAVTDNYTINEDTATNFEVLANDAGVGISIIAYDATTTAGQSVSQSGALLTYTPTNGFTGADTFTYTIEDTNGVQSTATVNVTVQEVVIDTGVLTANDDTVSVGTNSAVTAIDVTANDNYGTRGAHPGHPLTLPGGKTISASNNHGAIAVVNGKINYTPANGFTGTDTFNYTITDGGGFASSATVTITVGGTVVIDANAVTDNYTINEDTATDFEVLANDAGVGISIIAYDATTTAGQSVSQSGTLLTYTPTNGFTSADTFTYTIEDTNGVQSTATVNVTVQEVVIDTGVLTANDDTVNVGIGSVATPIDVTANDSFGVRGPHYGHPLTLTNGKIFTASNNHGTIEVVNGKVNYTPASGFSGIDTFTYTITDAGGWAATGTVTVTVSNATTTAFDNSFNINVNSNNTNIAELENRILSYSNTTSGYLNIRLYSTANTKASVMLVDITGKVVYTNPVDIKTGNNDLMLNLSLQPGIYFMKVANADVIYGSNKIILK
ncbi:Ig-like domain-containing protein [Wenyingzhuangia sp. IMCC45574]